MLPGKCWSIVHFRQLTCQPSGPRPLTLSWRNKTRTTLRCVFARTQVSHCSSQQEKHVYGYYSLIQEDLRDRLISNPDCDAMFVQTAVLPRCPYFRRSKSRSTRGQILSLTGHRDKALLQPLCEPRFFGWFGEMEFRGPALCNVYSAGSTHQDVQVFD